jgi:hypothetical protein
MSEQQEDQAVEDQVQAGQEADQAPAEETIADKIREKIQASTKDEESALVKEDAPAPYQPSYEYKVYDEAHQMPDWVKPFITSKEAEDNFRQIFSLGGGFEPLKTKHEALRQKYEQESQNFNKVYQTLDELQYLIDNKDLEGFFQKVNIKDNELLDYVKYKLRQDDLPKEQKELYNQNKTFLRKNYEQEREASLLAQQNQALLRNQHEYEYQKAFGLPEVAQFQRVFDEKLGPGAFRKHADSYGDQMYHQMQRNISPLDAVRHVMEQYKVLFNEPAPVSDPEMGSKRPEKKRPGGHLPNMGKGASQASPTTKRFQSIEDLKKYVEEIAG